MNLDAFVNHADHVHECILFPAKTFDMVRLPRHYEEGRDDLPT